MGVFFLGEGLPKKRRTNFVFFLTGNGEHKSPRHASFRNKMALLRSAEHTQPPPPYPAQARAPQNKYNNNGRGGAYEPTAVSFGLGHTL